MTVSGRLLGTAAGLVASRSVPPLDDRVHPVARFGASMTLVERALWRDERGAGAIYAGAGAALAAMTGRAAHSTALVVTFCAAGAQLRDVASELASMLESGDLEVARAELPVLVGRDPTQLDESGVAAAVIESVAENMVDAVIAPAFWGVVTGAPGVAVHRGLNTMDAMVGRRNERYGNFGWAAARADDVANLLPARAFALALVAVRPDRARAVLDAVRRDAPAHPSPNAGVAEAAMAGVLGVELGGPLRYDDVVEDRPVLGSGPRPDVAHLRAAIDLSRRVEDAVLVLLAAGALVGTARRVRRRRR